MQQNELDQLSIDFTCFGEMADIIGPNIIICSCCKYAPPKNY
jgi:hypothetical protein